MENIEEFKSVELVDEKMKSEDIAKKYDGKPCVLAPVIPCNLKTCSLSKCSRMQRYMSAGKGIAKPINDWKGRSLLGGDSKVDAFNACGGTGVTSRDASRAISALDRICNRGKSNAKGK